MVVRISFQRGGKSCVLGVLILGSCAHLIPSSNDECTLITLSQDLGACINPPPPSLRNHVELLKTLFWFRSLKDIYMVSIYGHI